MIYKIFLVAFICSLFLSFKTCKKDNFLDTEAAPVLTINDSISKLPFDADLQYDRMTSLVKKSENYNLPEINKLKYVNINYWNDSFCINDGETKLSNIANIYKFRKYGYRLPDVGQEEVYIVCDTVYDHLYNRPYDVCQNYKHQVAGYLLLYERLKKEAKVIEIFYQNFPLGIRRTFKIDSNYNIIISDFGLAYNDTISEIDDNLNWIEEKLYSYVLKIEKDGKVKVNYPKMLFQSHGDNTITKGPLLVIFSQNGDIQSITEE